jgi:hypothetical protein
MQSALLAQLVLHAFVPQLYGMQLEVGAAEQLPLPLQLDTDESVEPVHVVVPHDVVAGACAHAPAPSHVPVLPQGGFGVQRASAVAAGTLAHEPALAPTLQAWQVGQLPTPQQTPSVQKPDAHSLALAQVEPVAFLLRQLPPVPVQ